MAPASPCRRAMALLFGALTVAFVAACGDDVAPAQVPPAEPTPAGVVPPRRAGATEQTKEPSNAPTETQATDPPRRSTAAAPLTEAEWQLAAALGTDGEAEIAFDALDKGRRIAVIRAALRMDGTPAALFAAEQVHREWLDLPEMRLAAAILVREGLRHGAEDAASTLAWASEFGGAPDVATVITALAENPAPLADGGSIESLHTLLRAEHAPLVAKLLERAETRATGEEFANQLRKRSAAARAVLPPASPEEAVERALPDDDTDGALGEARTAALEPLVAESGRYSTFRTLRDADPVAARRALERFLTSGSDEAVGVFLEDMHENEVWPSPWIATRQVDPVFADLDTAVIPAITSPSRLASIALSVPGCGTRRMAEAICKLCASQAPLNEHEMESFTTEIGQDGRQYAATIHDFLSAGANPGFLVELRRFATADVRFVGLLFQIRDARSVPRLMEHETLVRSENSGMIPWPEWRRVPTPDVRAFLVGQTKSERSPALTPLESIAVIDGLPESLIDWIPQQYNAQDTFAEVRRLIFEARPIDALCVVLAANPDFFAEGLGDVRDPRVVAHLRGLLDKRDVVTYRDALDELAHAGDVVARAELRAAVEEGRYRWITDMTGRQTALGGDPREVYELWCRQLETNCCVDCCADANYFEHWFGFSPLEIAESLEFRTTAACPPEIAQSSEFRTTAADAARAWWKLHEGRFVWSDLAGHYVPEPR